MENTPSIEFRNSPVIPNMNKDKAQEDNIQQNINYNESLYEYFRVKNKYETKLYDARKTAFESAVSKKVGKKRAQLVKPKCIQCDRSILDKFEHLQMMLHHPPDECEHPACFAYYR